MADAKQLFAPTPLRAMAMDLSGLDARVLMCVACHDRMSLIVGKGQGCKASNVRMAAMVGCHYSRLCSTLTRLVDLGLLQREEVGKSTRYRVIYTDDDRALFEADRLPNGNMSAAPGDRPDNPPDGGAIPAGVRAEAAAGVIPSCCQTASQDGVICCQHSSETGGKLPETPREYIPQSGLNTFRETGEYNSSQEARFATRGIQEIVPDLSARRKENRQKAGQSRAARSKSVGERLASLERAMKDGTPIDRVAEYRWLGDEAFIGDDPTVNGWAMRLADKLVDSMTEDEHAAWCAEYGIAA